MTRSLPLLLPTPRQLRLGSAQLVLPARVRVGWPEEASPSQAWFRLERALAARGHALETSAVVSRSAIIEARIAPFGASPEAYRLHIAGKGITIQASGAAGLFYAVCTLEQLIRLSPLEGGALSLPELAIEDEPDFPARGVMLDVSRDKVPTLATLKLVVDRLASWKVNQLQLYMEHTFAYAGHERVWRDASPLSAAELAELDDYAHARHLELVPNQNSFGHMQRWLVHEPYRQLAECPDGFAHAWNPSGEPYGLCPTDPRCLALLEDLYDQLLPAFRSGQFNVGLDETIDLGLGRSRAACEALGTERVYLDFVKQVHARVSARGRRMQFWADIILKRPELLAELPRDAILLEWGYEADHPFAEHLELFRHAGLECQVCPGTSSWNSIAGRTDNAIANIKNAARAGKSRGARGLLNTDWGDHGHLQPLAVSWLGLLTGAAFSWNAADAERSDFDVVARLDAFAFADSARVLGRVAHDLGNSYLESGSLRANASVLFWLLVKPERVFSPAGVTPATLQRTLSHIERTREPLGSARPQSGDGELVVRELTWAADLLDFSCRLGLARCAAGPAGEVALVPRARRLSLAQTLDELIARHRSLWLERNRPGGLDDSARRLENLRETLLD